ncbi:LRR receptor-like serine/threonine-protein kinase GSO1 [Morella rubra]|uniref:LRR receptor-like serine/threonine-protein kinase GSO1 n=1 Tax=Morella rubra TaxID=262757 RepID=A0A6A1WWM2_9ROSI|nr:LRR receptor-like serine/threonine-protein kinase GSO1 [Morella rubra]
MASAYSFSVVVVAWITYVLLYGIYFNPVHDFAEASQSPTLQLEAEALLETRWWLRGASRALEIGTLSNLSYLNLPYNSFTGELPHSLANLTQLEELDISHNNIVGTIPKELRNCKSLRTLNLQSNNLIGQIPDMLSSYVSLKKLLLSHNHFTGSIPKYTCCSSSLDTIDLSHNFISGGIPFELGISFPVLSFLNISYNNLNGRIPRSLFPIIEVDLSYNFLRVQF